MEIDASRQLSPFFPDNRLLRYSGDEDRRGASQRWDSTPPDSNVKRAAWRNSSSKKAFVATLVTLVCMLVFKTKEATWCWNTECGFAEFRGLDFTVMQKMVDMRAASQSPRSNFPEEDSTASGVVVSGSNMSGAGERSDSMQQSPEREMLHTSRVTENSGCKGKADCPAEKLCVSKVCTCPVLYSGDHLCKSPTPGLAPGCITPITSPRLQQFARLRNISLPTPDFSVNNDTLRRSGRSTDLTQTAHEFWSNIQDLADFSTCAVVGSSSSLLSKDHARSFGAEIDDHSAVIRFNDAPTHGFEEWVGTKTTLRIQNVIYCGFKETPGEFCFRYTSKERRDGHIDMRATCRNPFRCRPINGTSEMLIYAMAYWQLSSLNVEHDTHNQPALPSDKYLRKMSAGFFGLALAAHLCGKVDAYGFDSGELHYYIKSPNLKHKTKSQCTLGGCKSKNSFSQRHSWRQENVCLAHLLGDGIPRLHIRTRPGEPV